MREALLWLGVGLIAATIIAFVAGPLDDVAERGSDVENYCLYGSVSRAQLRHCKQTVTDDEVRRYAERQQPTNAGRYGTGKLDHCLSDAGPFCVEK